MPQDNNNTDESYDPYSDPDSGFYDPYLDPDSPESLAWDDYENDNQPSPEPGDGGGGEDGDGEGACQEIPDDSCTIERIDDEHCAKICSWFDVEHGTLCSHTEDVDCPMNYS